MTVIKGINVRSVCKPFQTALKTSGRNFVPVALVLALCASARALQSGRVTTTVYVGRHFEVRDHDQPSKYVFNGATRVTEITGSLSTNLRVQRLRLYPGWNLCSLAVSGPFPATGAEAISAAYQWNPASSNYSLVTPGQTLAAGTVLWLKAGTNAVVSVLGAYVDPLPWAVQTGGTYIPGAGLETWSPALPDSASSWAFEVSTAEWFGRLRGDLASVSGPPPTLSPGQAFYLQAAVPASLDIPDPTLRIRYYHEDHLGSSSVISDSAGAIVEETAFYPFGTPRNEFRPRQVEEPYGFTQKERDRESGLNYFETRYLVGGLARFLTPDLKHACPDRLSPETLGGWLSFPQQLNLYAYVRNNPLRYIDPLGEDTSKPKDEPEPSETQAPVTLTLSSEGKEMTIPIDAWSLGASRQVNVTEVGGSQSKDKRAGQDFRITRTQDKWSKALFREVGKGKPMEAEVTMRRTVNGHSEVYLKIKLKAVVISHGQFSGRGNSDIPSESFTLIAAELEFEQPAQQPTEQIRGVGEQRVSYDLSKPEPPAAPAPSPPSGPDLNPFHLLKRLILHAPD